MMRIMEARIRTASCFAVAAVCALAGCSNPHTPSDAGAPDAANDADIGHDADVRPRDVEIDVESDGEELETSPDADNGQLLCDSIDFMPRNDMGFLELGEASRSEELERCTVHQFAFAAAFGSRVELELTSLGMFGVVAAITYPDAPSYDRQLIEARAETLGEPVTIGFEPHRSGEFMILVRGVTPEVAQRYELDLVCVEGCELETTRYPQLLVHGWTGFDSIGPLEYFYEVPETLAGQGYLVFVAELDPYNSIEVRAEQLSGEVDEALRNGRARRVNLVAHSQGGLDSRYLISTLGYGDRISSLTTIATPHQGTPLCDVALGLLPGPGEVALSALLNLLGATIMGSESDAEASFTSLTEDHVRNVFNPANPDDPRVSYISWTGRTCLYGISCDDICDIEIRWAYDIIYLTAGDNDGIVPVSSAQWGDYRGEVPADHFDEVGQLFGVTNENFDHREFYLERARDLAREGH